MRLKADGNGTLTNSGNIIRDKKGGITMAFVSSGYNPDKPMGDRITDIGPRHFEEFYPPVIKNNKGKWLYHEILEPGV